MSAGKQYFIMANFWLNAGGHILSFVPIPVIIPIGGLEQDVPVRRGPPQRFRGPCCPCRDSTCRNLRFRQGSLRGVSPVSRLPFLFWSSKPSGKPSSIGVIATRKDDHFLGGGRRCLQPGEEGLAPGVTQFLELGDSACAALDVPLHLPS